MIWLKGCANTKKYVNLQYISSFRVFEKVVNK